VNLASKTPRLRKRPHPPKARPQSMELEGGGTYTHRAAAKVMSMSKHKS